MVPSYYLRFLPSVQTPRESWQPMNSFKAQWVPAPILPPLQRLRGQVIGYMAVADNKSEWRVEREKEEVTEISEETEVK